MAAPARQTHSWLTRLAVLVCAAISLAAVPSASADTFCVSHSGCPDPGHNFATVQQAVDAADANDPPTPPVGTATRDTILVGPGVFDGAVVDDFDNPVDIFGSGRHDPAAAPGSQGTLIKRADGNSLTTVQLSSSFGTVAASSLHDLTVQVPTGSSNTGIYAQGIVENVDITAAGSLTNGVGLDLYGNGFPVSIYRGGSVDLPGTATGTLLHNALVERSSIKASTGASGGGIVRRSTIDANIGALAEFLGLEDCVMHVSGPGAIAFKASGIGFNVFSRIQARHVTAIGDGGGDALAVEAVAQASSSDNSATVDIGSSILRGFAKNFKRSGDSMGGHTGTADITVAYSDYDMTLPKDDAGGPGSINETSPGGNTSATPGFPSPTDYHLAFNSPLIDSGDPSSPGQNLFFEPESTVDFDGLPRKVDGDGNGIARADIGAYEFQQKLPTITSAKASSAKPLVRHKVRFKAKAHDTDGEPVRFHWSFGDGSGANGASVTHRYSNGGRKKAVLTVTDFRGLKRSRTVNLIVRGPVVKIKKPASGAQLTKGQPVTARYSCSEPFGPSKVVSCAGPVARGQLIDTTKHGKHVFKVTAVDGKGTKSFRTVRYFVK